MNLLDSLLTSKRQSDLGAAKKQASEARLANFRQDQAKYYANRAAEAEKGRAKVPAGKSWLGSVQFETQRWGRGISVVFRWCQAVIWGSVEKIYLYIVRGRMLAYFAIFRYVRVLNQTWILRYPIVLFNDIGATIAL